MPKLSYFRYLEVTWIKMFTLVNADSLIQLPRPVLIFVTTDLQVIPAAVSSLLLLMAGFLLDKCPIVMNVVTNMKKNLTYSTLRTTMMITTMITPTLSMTWGQVRVTSLEQLSLAWAEKTKQFRSLWLGLRRIWSRTHLIPGLPVLHFLSPWTNDPHKIDPLDKRSLSNLVPMDNWSPIMWSPWKNGPQPIWSTYQN